MWINTIHGTKYAQERVTDEITGRTHIVSVKVTKAGNRGEIEAMRRLEDKLSAKKSTNKRLSDCVKLYIAMQSRTMKPSTVRRNKASLERLIKILDDPYVDKMTAGYIREKLIGTGKEPGTMNEYLRRLKSCLRWCVSNDIVETNVAERLGNFHEASSHRARIADKYLEPEQVNSLVDAIELPKYKLLTQFLALSGLRVGEALALDLDDLDSDIHVRHTVDPLTGELTSTKTATSTRDVHIQPELAAVVKAVKVWRLEQRLYCGYADVPYLFPDENGNRILYYSYLQYVKAVSIRVLGRKVTAHTLRHTHCSLLAASGLSFDQIARRLGHSDSQVTREIYFHVTKKLKAQDDAAMDAVRLL